MQKQMQLISSPHSDLKCDSYEASLDAERESESDTVENESRVEYFSEGKNGTDVSQPQKASSIVEDSIRKDIICTMFDLPTSTTFYPDFSCALSATFAMHGRMYPTSDVLCFYSNVFGRERKILIPYQFIITLQKTTTLMFQLAIRIEVQNDCSAKPKEYTFTSFWGNNRDCCFKLLTAIREQCRHPSEDREVAWGDSRDDETSENDLDDASASEEQVNDRTSNAESDLFNTDYKSLRDDSMQLVTDQSFAVTPEEFMKQFIYDNAPFGLNEFYRKIGYWDITLDPWTQSNDMDGKTRSARYRVPVDAPLGPSTSLVDSVQCCKRPNQCVYIVETSTRIVDVPYGDHFSVIDRWTIMPIQLESGVGTHLQIELKVAFSKSTLWKSTICSKAAAENTKKFEQWVSHAKETLAARSSSVELSGTKHHKARVPATRNRSAGMKTNISHRKTVDANKSQKHSSAFLNGMYWVLVLLFAIIAIHFQATLGRMERLLLQAREDLDHIRHELHQIKAINRHIPT
ncbi:unnamed protein product [Albugo candida]|nr:unnamed protein product [Albugo candida]|eukprot:CCI47912.1 unnamed protein product [Albugo candida]